MKIKKDLFQGKASQNVNNEMKLESVAFPDFQLCRGHVENWLVVDGRRQLMQLMSPLKEECMVY